MTPKVRYDAANVADLVTFAGNPRRGAVDSIAASLTKHGQYRPIVVNAGTHTGRQNEVLAGNHTLLAARSLGWSSIDVAVVDVDEQAARSIVLADNRLADLGSYDDRDLFELLDSIDVLHGTGFETGDRDDLYRQLFPDEPLTDKDDVPDLPAVEPVSKLGDVWQLGRHRLLVGDATDADAVVDLFGGERAQCVWTDPPYGVNYVGKTKAALEIRNDSSQGLGALLEAAFTVVVSVAAPGAPLYVAHADTERVTFELAMQRAGMIVRQNLIWAKNTMVLGRSDYHYKHEPILYGGAPGEPDHEPILYGFAPGGEGRLGRGGPNWHGDNKQTTVFNVDKPPRNADHPTMKPVALIEAMLANSCRPQGIVFDPFGGSGSTLIAAHHRDCSARLVELDPRYADVICRRYEQHTGDKPVRRGGDAVSFVAQAAA